MLTEPHPTASGARPFGGQALSSPTEYTLVRVSVGASRIRVLSTIYYKKQ